MRVVCRHGHFSFYPTRAGQLSSFCETYSITLVRVDDYYTFEPLSELPRYSILGRVYGNLPALSTFEADHAWKVMKQNRFVYNIELGLLVPVATVLGLVSIPLIRYFFTSQRALVQPGLINKANGQRIVSYDAEIMHPLQHLRIGSLEYEEVEL